MATDLDWTQGDGAVVAGPGEALLMAIAGRPDAVAALSGDGVPLLRSRLPGADRPGRGQPTTGSTRA